MIWYTFINVHEYAYKWWNSVWCLLKSETSWTIFTWHFDDYNHDSNFHGYEYDDSFHESDKNVHETKDNTPIYFGVPQWTMWLSSLKSCIREMSTPHFHDVLLKMLLSLSNSLFFCIKLGKIAKKKSAQSLKNRNFCLFYS